MDRFMPNGKRKRQKEAAIGTAARNGKKANEELGIRNEE
jgi:hypothetical protein